MLEEARDRVAEALRGKPAEVVFTASATEANNLALLGAARGHARLAGEPPVLVGSEAEHPSVLGALRLLQQDGFPLRLVPVDAHGRADVPALLAVLGAERAEIVAVQWANNETGAVQDLAALTSALPQAVHWHCDAVQGVGKLPWEAALDAASTLVVSGHKIGAPKGIAALRVRESAFLDPVLAGGGQQRRIRPGTENPAAAAAFALALRLAIRDQAEFATTAAAACGAFLGALRSDCPELRENHPDEGQPRLPNTVSITFPGIDGRALLPACDAEGLAVSSGSACSSGAAQPSALLLACGLDKALARATLRVSFGPEQGEEVGAEAARRLARAVHRLYQLRKH